MTMRVHHIVPVLTRGVNLVDPVVIQVVMAASATAAEAGKVTSLAREDVSRSVAACACRLLVRGEGTSVRRLPVHIVRCELLSVLE